MNGPVPQSSIPAGCDFRDKTRVLSDCRQLESSYPSLKPFVKDGRLGFTGHIPMQHRGAEYRIPVHIWLDYDYPIVMPICHVIPVNNLAIAHSCPHLTDSRVKEEAVSGGSWDVDFTLVRYVDRLSDLFGRSPPLYDVSSTATRPESQTQSARPPPSNSSLSYTTSSSSDPPPSTGGAGRPHSAIPAPPNQFYSPSPHHSTQPHLTQHHLHSQPPFQHHGHPVSQSPHTSPHSFGQSTHGQSNSVSQPRPSAQAGGGSPNFPPPQFYSRTSSPRGDPTANAVQQELLEKFDVIYGPLSIRHATEYAQKERLHENRLKFEANKHTVKTKIAEIQAVTARLNKKSETLQQLATQPLDFEAVLTPAPNSLKELLMLTATDCACEDVIKEVSSMFQSEKIDFIPFVRAVTEWSRKGFHARRAKLLLVEKLLNPAEVPAPQNPHRLRHSIGAGFATSPGVAPPRVTTTPSTWSSAAPHPFE